jgi:hypothetical protein
LGDDSWYLVGDDQTWHNGYFDKIDEQQIKRAENG